MKPWIDRQLDVTPDERLVYDMLETEEAIWHWLAPPYTLDLARKILVELDASREGVIPHEAP